MTLLHRAGRTLRSPAGVRATRYTAGSVVATVCSEVAFLLLYGVAHTGSTAATVLGWLAGAVPNYLLNRSWAWGRKGRPQLARELLPYAGIVAGTLAVASVTTHYAGIGAASVTELDWLRVLLVGAAFLGTYGVLFVVRFMLLDRLFRGRRRSRHQVASTAHR